jgi:DNA-binding XRE family transcriptional regulator
MPRSSKALETLPPEIATALGRLGQRLRARRLDLNWTVEQTAERLLCSPTTYRALEGGRPTVSLGLLASALWLFGEAGALNGICPIDEHIVGKRRARRTERMAGAISDDERDF